MQTQIAALQEALPTRQIYWLGAPNAGEQEQLAGIADPVASYRFGLATRRVDWYDARDDLGMRDLSVNLYRLRPKPAAAALH